MGVLGGGGGAYRTYSAIRLGFPSLEQSKYLNQTCNAV